MTMTEATARQRLAEATQDLADVEAELEQVRVAVSNREAKDGDVRAVQRRITRFTERLAQAKVDARLAEERAQAERAQAERDAEKAARELEKIVRAKQQAEGERFRLWLEATRTDLIGFDRRLLDFDDQLRGQHMSLPLPSRWQSYRLWLDCISDQQKHLPLERKDKEA
jgi:RNase H-fold protein (predicted Holliday junction resolvase)